MFALPGVPTFFAQKVSAIVGGFLGPPRHTHASARKVTLCVDEAKLALLISAAAQAHPLVKVEERKEGKEACEKGKREKGRS